MTKQTYWLDVLQLNSRPVYWWLKILESNKSLNIISKLSRVYNKLQVINSWFCIIYDAIYGD